MITTCNGLSFETIHKVLKYDGGKLYWRKREEKDQYAKAWNTRYANKEAGSIDSKGYKYLSLRYGGKKKNYRLHRIIWLMFYKSLPEYLDHRNGVRTDNYLHNLRPATVSQNITNSRSKGSSGFKGVCYSEERKHPWTAQTSVKGKHVYIGQFSTPEEAARAYDTYALEKYGEFARINFPQAN